jgi:hypothetical protein
VVLAERDIKKGEEIFTSYFGNLEVGRKERRKRLMPWLGRDYCRCPRCERGEL